jgi:putative hydrolase of the HAD superfamily
VPFRPVSLEPMASTELAPLEAVLLDVGGVFLLPAPEVMAPALERYGGISPDIATLDRAHYAGTAAMDAAGEADWPLYLTTYVRACGVPDALVAATAAALGTVFNGHIWTRVIPGAPDALRELLALDVKIGIVSNAAGTIAQMLASAGICQLGEGPGVPVGVLIDSHVVGVAKPDPAIFQLALDALEVAPRNTLYIGDTAIFDVVGAHAAGLDVLHIDPHDMCAAATDPHQHRRHLRDCLAHIRAALRGAGRPGG